MDIMSIIDNKKEILSVLWNTSKCSIKTNFTTIDNFVIISFICDNKLEREYVRMSK